MKVDILGKTEDKLKMEDVERKIKAAAAKTNVPVQIHMTNNFRAFAQHSFNPSLTPIVFMDGEIEFQGSVQDVAIIQQKLIELRDKGSQTF